MRHTGVVLLLFWCACWFVCSATAGAVGDAAPGDWVFVRRVGDIEIYRRPVSGSDVPAVRARTHFPASVGDVYQVVADYNHFAGFIPYVSESRVLEQDERATRVYQRLDFPVPIADRHYVIKVVNEVHARATHVIDVSWQLDTRRSMALSTQDALLPDAFSGSWHLDALSGQAGCDAVYTIHVDPAGGLPNWLFVRVTEHYVVKVLNAVRNRLAGDTVSQAVRAVPAS